MNQNKRRPALNRNQTRTLLNTMRIVTTAGAISLTITGWGLLAKLDAGNIAQAKNNQPLAMVAPASNTNVKRLTDAPSQAAPLPTASVAQATRPTAPIAQATLPSIPPTPVPATPTPQPVRRLDIVQWVQDAAGDQVAVVRDRRGTMWYVMGSDVPRIEQGQAPAFQPQPVQIFSRTRAS